MSLTLQTHEYSLVKGQPKLIRHTPYILFSVEGEEYFLQSGTLYTPSGKAIEEIPDKVMAQINEFSDDALKSVKFRKPKKKPLVSNEQQSVQQ